MKKANKVKLILVRSNINNHPPDEVPVFIRGTSAGRTYE